MPCPVPRRLPFRRAAGRAPTWLCSAAAIAFTITGCADPVAEPAGGEGDAADVTADVVAAPIVPGFVAAEMADGPRVELTGVWHEDVKRLRVSVHIANFPKLIGIAGHLRFDPDALAISDLAVHPVPAGDPDDADTWEPHSIGRESPAGRVLMGGARFRLAPHPYLPLEGAAVDRELWLEADFEIKKPGTHKLAFDPASLVARDHTGKDLAVQWGSAEIKSADAGLNGGTP